jgi:Tfp pilus assembly protein PilX
MTAVVHNDMNTSRHTHDRGFTLLLAALVSSIVLSLGAAIYSLAVKELQLSSLGRDSQYAFFAADTGAECALYWDVRYDYFATSAPASVVAPDPRCDTQSFTALGRATSYPYTMSFSLDVSVPSSATTYCTKVSVTKAQSGGVLQTTIHSDGYNGSCATYATSKRTLQRSVELHY